MAFRKKFSGNKSKGSSEFSKKFTHVASVYLNEGKSGAVLGVAFKEEGARYLMLPNNFTTEGKRVKKVLDKILEEGGADEALFKIFQKNEEDEYFSKKSSGSKSSSKKTFKKKRIIEEDDEETDSDTDDSDEETDEDSEEFDED